MHTLTKHQISPFIGLALLAMIVALALVWCTPHHAMAGMLTASMFVPVVPKTADEFTRLTTPTRTMVVRAPLYDTQTIVSGTTTSLTFFNAINNDKTLSNARGNGGSLPQNTAFEPLWINVDFLATNVLGANVITGALDDIDRIVKSGRGILEITIGQTTLPQIPISYCHASGGAVGAIGASFTAPQNAQFANNGAQDSGYCIAGSFMLTQNTPFSCKITWPAAITVASTTPLLRLSFDGNWYLPISG